jgi:hypothetical protein
MSQLSVQQRRTGKLALLAVTVVAGLVFYASIHHQRPQKILVGRDVSDSPGLDPNRAKSFYDPVFVQVNHSADFAYSVTNPITLGN